MKEKLINALTEKLNSLETQPNPDQEELKFVKDSLKMLGVDINQPHPDQESLTL